MKTPDKKPPRKPYRPPVLERYGDVRKLTKLVGNKGMNDPGSSSGTKTG
jgi:hypothetical protein